MSPSQVSHLKKMLIDTIVLLWADGQVSQLEAPQGCPLGQTAKYIKNTQAQLF